MALVVLVVAAAARAGDVPREPRSAVVDFNRDIRPILSDNCFKCHGPDAAERQAGLRLDDRQSATSELDSGLRAIVPGDVERSELVRRIFAEDEFERMPPADSQKSLTEREKELLKAWVHHGGQYAAHWSFTRPSPPEVPNLPDDEWSRGEIDRFVWRKLRANNLVPSPEADRRTLIRRVSFDLTGLPPTIEEVEAFLADERPGAFERVVDRLLASPRFGERMAMHWLDLARYADTDGYEKDGHRQMWPYRDWVIKAFNENLPFDQFTIEQLAGDLLPNPTRDQLIATAFNRNNPTTSEAGSDPDEFAAKYAVDRVSTTANVWLGLTMQCAECHDHKFDPIATEDFYRLFAFFNQMPEVPLYEGPDAPPSITVGTPEQEAKLATLDREIAAAKRELDGQVQALLAKQPSGEDAERAKGEASVREKLARLEQDAAALRDAIPKLRIMQPAAQRMPTYILVRGDYRRPGKEVTAGIPASFGSLPAPADRLALARWIVGDENPLTARVVVNRYWEILFGTGLVATANDFGYQGASPSLPELLDWLALRFQRDWDTKALLRSIVTSSTYRQSSRVTSELAAADPENRLLARGPRQRLPAEMIRDNALAVSGLLNEKVGGPSVYPYHPSGLWEEMAWADSPWKIWPTDSGANLYRRGLYTFWKRSVLHPVLALFDAPTRTVCEVSRSTTNTPLQALATLNETSFVEAARALATRMIEAGGGKPEAAVVHGYRRVLARPPLAEEQRILVDLYERLHAHYEQQPDDAQALLSVGEHLNSHTFVSAEHAAWTCVAQVLLNLDETITKQ